VQAKKKMYAQALPALLDLLKDKVGMQLWQGTAAPAICREILRSL
jgi:hypothetical protein